MKGKPPVRIGIDDTVAHGNPAEILASLARAKALFQARTVAMILGAPMPDPAAFKAPGK